MGRAIVNVIQSKATVGKYVEAFAVGGEILYTNNAKDALSFESKEIAVKYLKGMDWDEFELVEVDLDQSSL